jgi:pyruvate ferredoxin oxidoreductase beta subunit/2-oxoisovalerate ferredoxin oxidoreductase beta subunit
VRPYFALPQAEEILHPGHYACPGCGLMPALRLLLKTLGRNTVLVVPACCYAVIDGPYPYSAAGVPLVHSAFAAAAAYASGVRAGLDAQGQDQTQVVVVAGDGGTFDIGLQALSAAAERNENILYFCYDNEAYMNTGIQRSSATPRGAWTTTTPAGAPKPEPKKDLGAIMAAHRIPYFATASPAFPDDLYHKIARARDIRGFRMIHCLSPCPTGWKSDSAEMITLARLAVRSRVFPLYEVEHGDIWRLTCQPEPVPVREYLKVQGRFAHLGEEQIQKIQQEVEGAWERLLRRCSAGSPPGPGSPGAPPAQQPDGGRDSEPVPSGGLRVD